MSKARAELKTVAPTPALEESTRNEQPAWLNLVSEKVKNLNYGVIQIVVHDSRVVQVERTERHRFDVHSGS